MIKILNTLLLAGLLVLGLSSSLQGQLVLTVAGVLDSIGMQDGEVYQATFNNPHCVATDTLGNVYIADRFGHTIRKISPSGFVQTIAGTGVSGFADGEGYQAQFNEPWGICADNQGNVYVADTRNNRIRKIDTDGVVSTIAGSGNFGTTNGIGTAATFGNPTGIEITEEGIIYVADHLTHIIRRIDQIGMVSTLAGTPYTPGSSNGTGIAARFYRPYGLSIDNEGNIIVADEWNHLIRKITPSGAVTTIAGNGVVGSSDGAALSSSLNYPWDIAIDTIGNIFIADGYNDVIRKLNTQGEITTYVGTAGNSGATDGTGPLATFNGATGIAYMKETDELYVSDAYNQLVRKIINLNQQTVAGQILNPSGNILCLGEALSVKAVPEIYDTYYFYINGSIMQDTDDNIFEYDELPVGIHNLQIVAYYNGESISSNQYIITVLENEPPSISVVGNTVLFEGDSVTLIASNGTNYLWSNGATEQVITVYQAGDYSVEVTNANGCVNTSEPVSISFQNVSAAPLIGYFEDGNPDLGCCEVTLCHGEAIILASDWSTGNQWLLDGFPISGATASSLEVTQEGIYQVRVTDSQGFNLISNAVAIEVQDQLLYDFEVNKNEITLSENPVQFTVDAISGLSYLWDFGDDTSSSEKNPSHFYSEAGVYDVTLSVEDSEGCTATLTKVAYVTVVGDAPSQEGVIYIPNTFTPNDDGQNDLFLVRGENIASLHLEIFNQWGELVFTSDSPSEGWDGTCQGLDAQQATYVYWVSIQLDNGYQEIRKGELNLLR